MIAAPTVSPALKARDAKGPSSDGDGDGDGAPLIAHSLRASGFDASEDGTGRGTPIVPVVSPTLRAGGNKTGGDRPPGTDVDTADSLIAFSSKDHGADAQREVAPTLRAMGHDGSHANAGGQVAIAIQERAICENPDAGPDGIGVRDDGAAYTIEARQVPQAVAMPLTAGMAASSARMPHEQGALIPSRWAVRRLTPMECERLQGFPDGYTDVPSRGKNYTPDGPRYKALGNSMACNVMRWIGTRIQMVEDFPRPSLGQEGG